jgi:hypothetical protein
MELKGNSQINEFLNKFYSVLEYYAVANQQQLKKLQPGADGKVFLVEPLAINEFRFLIQFYNKIAKLDFRKEIDLDLMMSEFLKENELYGIETSLLDQSLLIFFARYEIVKPTTAYHIKLYTEYDEHVGGLHEAVKRIDPKHFFYQPVKDLLEHKSKTEVNAEVKLNLLKETRMLVAPKLGEKNCFSFDARTQDYKKALKNSRLANFGNVLLGIAEIILGAAIIAGTIVGSYFLGSLVTFPLTIAVSLGTTVGSIIPGLCGGILIAKGGQTLFESHARGKFHEKMGAIASAKPVEVESVVASSAVPALS